MTTAGAGRSRPGTTRTWVIPIGVVAGLIVAALAGLISKSVFLDLIAWWPAWLALFLIFWFSRGRKLGVVRVSGLVSLLGLILVVAFAVGHVRGWPTMASSAGRLIGPEVADDVEQAGLVASIDGRLVVGSGSDFLYQVTPIRWGGRVGLPDATEDTIESTVTVNLVVPSDPGLQVFSGWNLLVSNRPVWDLDLGGEIDADLAAIAVSGLNLTGSGTVRLAAVQFLTEGTIEGEFSIEIPGSGSVRIVGEATVPSGWERLEDGWQSPDAGDGWLLTIVPGSSVVITTS